MEFICFSERICLRTCTCIKMREKVWEKFENMIKVNSPKGIDQRIDHDLGKRLSV